jgi:hypothetical protein
MDAGGSARPAETRPGQEIGEGRLWSLMNSLVCTGRYCVFRDGSGWFACDVTGINVGALMWLELDSGERRRVKISRKAARNLIFRPDVGSATDQCLTA